MKSVGLCIAMCLLAEPGFNSGEIRPAVDRGVEVLLEVQEGAEWPYEGVYRVDREIPIGYRVGGTGIASMALIEAPGYTGDPDRGAAVARAAEFIVGSIDDPLMGHDVEAKYDVRGWGYTYGLLALLALDRHGVEVEGADAAIRFFIDGIDATAIPQAGGWNYSRRAGFAAPGPAAPFMTAPTLQALFAARAQGHEVSDEIVMAGLDTLERSRTATGAFVYRSGKQASRVAVPGATGRMLCSEIALYLGNRSNATRLRGALDAFLAHWQWLDDRRAKTGTHAKPYGIAPYYFYFAHYYAAQAIELLPEYEREEYRRRLHELLFDVRLPDGSWNDRVFERSANYGTAMCVLALVMPDAEPPARWRP